MSLLPDSSLLLDPEIQFLFTCNNSGQSPQLSQIVLQAQGENEICSENRIQNKEMCLIVACSFQSVL